MTRHVALCCGLNYAGSGNDLSGCVNDANDWAALWTRRGFNVTTILEPAKTEFVQAVRQTLAPLRPADTFVLTFSGHGSWVPDRDGDEADARDEVLCLADFQSGGIVTDDELFTLLDVDVRRLVLSDSCHSGSVSRFVAPAAAGVPRFIPPQTFLPPSQLPAAHRVEHLPARGVPRPGAALISGCADTEYSYDAWFGSRANGAFTRAAIDARFRPAFMSLGVWYRTIRRTLPNEAYPQAPQLTATPEQTRWRF